MSIVNVKLSQRNKNKYRKVLSTKESVYESATVIINSSNPYSAGATLENGEWFYIEDAKNQPYSSEILDCNTDSVNYDSLERDEFDKIDYLFTVVDDNIFFQNISKAKLISKKMIVYFGELYKYENNQQGIVINELPDAIFVSSENRLYFRRLESITSIFKGIEQLYREATNEEVKEFLEYDFVELQNGFDASGVNTLNRKRIALAPKTLSTLNDKEKTCIFDYIGEYCPNLRTDKGKFKIGTDDDLKILLYGIEQRFYTTIIGGEKRIANSVIPL